MRKLFIAALSGLLTISNANLLHAEDESGWETIGLFPETEETVSNTAQSDDIMDVSEDSHDVNGDEITDEQDVLAVLEFVAKYNSTQDLPEYDEEAVDVNGDGSMDTLDAWDLAEALGDAAAEYIEKGTGTGDAAVVPISDTAAGNGLDSIYSGVFAAEYDPEVTEYITAESFADYCYIFNDPDMTTVFVAFVNLKGIAPNESFADISFVKPAEVTTVNVVTYENNGEFALGGEPRPIEIGGDEPVVEDPIFINSRSAELEEKIRARIYVYVPDSELDTTYITTTFNGVSKTEYAKTMDTAVRSGRLCRVVSVDTFAKQMRDDIVVKVHEEDGTPKYLEYEEEDVTEGYVFHIEDYVNSVEEKATDEKLIDLVRKMNWYGLYAQQQFNYNPVTFEEPAVITNFNDDVLADYAVQNTGTVNGIEYTSGSLQLDADTGVKVNYTLTGTDTISDYTFTVDGTEVEPKFVSGKRYCVTFKGIPAKKLNEWHTITVTDKAGNTLTTKYCGLTYTYSVVSNASAPETLKDLCRSIYLYWEAAYNYFPKPANN